jgi:uroporphyrinogen-III synthase
VLEQFRSATSDRTLVISIGPTCSEALVDNGFTVHAEASPPKMGQLARVAVDALKARTGF